MKGSGEKASQADAAEPHAPAAAGSRPRRAALAVLDWFRENPQTALGLLLVVLVVGTALVLLDVAGVISIRFMVENFGFFLMPAAISLFATCLSFVIGFTLGIPLGLVRAFGPNIIKRRTRASAVVAPLYGLTTGYVEAIRGTPAFVQILLVSAYVNRAFPGPDVVLWGGVLALTINTIGYQAEVFRAGFQSVGQGQIEAAKSVGMRPVQTFANITLPQSLRLIMLPLVNEWVALFKASAILWYISVQELMWAAKTLGYNETRPVEAFLMVAFVYLLIILPLSRGISHVERAKRIPGLGVAEAARVRRPRKAPGSVAAGRVVENARGILGALGRGGIAPSRVD